MKDEELKLKLNALQAKLDYLRGKKTLDMQEQFDLSQIALEAAFLRIDELEERVRELEREAGEHE